MALTLFWGVTADSATLQNVGTTDYSAGDTVAQGVGSPVRSTNGMSSSYAYGAAANTQFGYGFSINNGGSIIPSCPTDGATACSSLELAVGFNLYMATAGMAGDFYSIAGFALTGANAAHYLRLGMLANNTLCLRITNGTNSATLASITTIPGADQGYGVVGRVDLVNSKAKIELYTHGWTHGATPTLVDSNETTGSSWGSTYGFIANTSSTGVQWTLNASAHASGAAYLDNLFLADDYDEPIQNNLTIAAYSSYNTASSIARLAAYYRMLRNVNA